MISRWIYRVLFRATLDRLETILFIDRNARAGRHYSEEAARREIERNR